MSACPICGSVEATAAVRTRVRMGRFGDLSDLEHDIMRCSGCGVLALPDLLEDRAGYYESEQYRADVDGSFDACAFHALHDAEQTRHLRVTGTELFRDAVVADIGCGAGSFLDAVSGLVKRRIAVEPAAMYHAHLAGRGCDIYPYAADAVKDHAGEVDVAVSFAVIEHLEDPQALLRDARTLLRPGGHVVISTPNTRDVLLEALPDVYPSFFFRKVHSWYFDADSLERALTLAGFTDVRIVPVQRFGLGNFLGWLAHERPTGDAMPAYVTPAVDAVWRAELERTGRADFLYAIARAPQAGGGQ